MPLVSVMLLLLLALITASVKSSPTREEFLSYRCVEVPCHRLQNCQGKCATLCVFKPVNTDCRFKGNTNSDKCIRYDETCRTPKLPAIPCRATKPLSCKMEISFP